MFHSIHDIDSPGYLLGDSGKFSQVPAGPDHAMSIVPWRRSELYARRRSASDARCAPAVRHSDRTRSLALARLHSRMHSALSCSHRSVGDPLPRISLLRCAHLRVAPHDDDPGSVCVLSDLFHLREQHGVDDRFCHFLAQTPSGNMVGAEMLSRIDSAQSRLLSCS
jgi:hypothetical protein